MGILIKVLLIIVGFISLSGSICFANNAITVVANTQDRGMLLSRHEVRNLFMGTRLGYNFIAITLPPENQTRVIFNTKVIGLTESRIQSYWAQMRFTGRKKIPREVASEQLMLEYLQNNKGAVGYLPASLTLPDDLTVIYTIL